MRTENSARWWCNWKKRGRGWQWKHRTNEVAAERSAQTHEGISQHFPCVLPRFQENYKGGFKYLRTTFREFYGINAGFWIVFLGSRACWFFTLLEVRGDSEKWTFVKSIVWMSEYIFSTKNRCSVPILNSGAYPWTIRPHSERQIFKNWLYH